MSAAPVSGSSSRLACRLQSDGLLVSNRHPAKESERREAFSALNQTGACTRLLIRYFCTARQKGQEVSSSGPEKVSPSKSLDGGSSRWFHGSASRLFPVSAPGSPLRDYRSVGLGSDCRGPFSGAVLVPKGAMDSDEGARWLAWAAEQFQAIAGEDQEIDLEEFKSAFQVKESFFAERFFVLFDTDGSGRITLDELLEALKRLIYGSEADKLRFLFQVYDVDGSGAIDSGELRTVLKSCLKESSISLPEEKLDDLTQALFESADADHNGSITFEELKRELERFPGVMENLTISAANWLKPPQAPKKRGRVRCLTPTYWQNHSSQLLFLGGFGCVNTLLFAFGALRQDGSDAWMMLAKGCGHCLNFNCSFIVVLMLRRCLTWLRATWAARVLPLDQHVLLHQVVGYVVVAVAAVHTGAHVANFAGMSEAKEGYHLWESLFTTRPGIGWFYGTASLSGLLLQVLIGLVLVCSHPFIRKSGHFEVFYWTHLSYIFIWALLIIHSPNFWKWFLVPGFLFLLEKILGVALKHIRGLHIVEIHLLPSKVTHLVIKRPPFFHYKPGDYVYLNIPVIAKYEWHPFTISSAPEQAGTIGLHIRSLGQWTSRLYEHFSRHSDRGPHRLARDPRKKGWSQKWVQECLLGSSDLDPHVATNQDEMIEVLSYTPTRGPGWGTASTGVAGRCEEVSGKLDDNQQHCSIKCYIDGPYGTPTRRIFTSEHAVLIGAGIGVTPFASILQSVMHRYCMRQLTSFSPSNMQRAGLKNEEMKLRKVRGGLGPWLGGHSRRQGKGNVSSPPSLQVDFIWINRDQKSFEWFVSLLAQLEADQAESDPGGRFLEMQLYMTSALSKNDVKAVGLQIALELLARKEKRDCITGLKTRTHPGRPDWSQVFQKLALEKKGEVHVFFCGSPALAKVVRAHSEQFGFRFFQEHF
ncbi:NADPH oxidase 5 isoform X3 [Paroedura picta]|uniref:NADPH oxidase 5 isoform X3 n=1 Tax=Paroedura picta TaxID=143630 RepID=UPI004056F61E